MPSLAAGEIVLHQHNPQLQSRVTALAILVPNDLFIIFVVQSRGEPKRLRSATMAFSHSLNGAASLG